MINQTLQKALNHQISEDQHCSRLYGAMAAHCEKTALQGFAKWLRGRSRHKQDRAESTTRYILRQRGELEWRPLDAPENGWDSPLAMLEAARQREHYVTERLGELATLAQTEGDHATTYRLQRMVSKQAKDEAATARLVEQLKFAGDTSAGLLLLDRSLA
jgi:ferritin